MKTILSIFACLLIVMQTEAQTAKSFRTSDGETLILLASLIWK